MGKIKEKMLPLQEKQLLYKGLLLGTTKEKSEDGKPTKETKRA